MRCFLAGLYLAVVAVWLAWLASWINRVELRSRAAPVVSLLGFTFEREGVRAEVVASGTFGGRVVRVRWRASLLGERMHAALDGGPWIVAPDGGDLESWLRSLVG